MVLGFLDAWWVETLRVGSETALSPRCGLSPRAGLVGVILQCDPGEPLSPSGSLLGHPGR